MKFNIGFKTHMIKDYLQIKNMSIEEFCERCVLSEGEFDLLLDDGNESQERFDLIIDALPLIANLLKVEMHEMFDSYFG